MDRMATRHAALAAFAAAVFGFAIYLLVEVHAAAAHGAAPDHVDRVEHPAQVATTPPPVEPPSAAKPPSPSREGRAGPFKIDIHPTTNPAPAPTLATPAGTPAAGSADKPALDASMAEANKAYDSGDWDQARAGAEKILADQPNNQRMLRIVVSVACLDGDQAAAQKAYDLLPAPDRAQMKTRCARSGVSFSDSTPPP
jgi:hypothetical protein